MPAKPRVNWQTLVFRLANASAPGLCETTLVLIRTTQIGTKADHETLMKYVSWNYWQRKTTHVANTMKSFIMMCSWNVFRLAFRRKPMKLFMALVMQLSMNYSMNCFMGYLMKIVHRHETVHDMCHGHDTVHYLLHEIVHGQEINHELVHEIFHGHETVHEMSHDIVHGHERFH